MSSSRRTFILQAGLLLAVVSLTAQTQEKFKARLYPVPLDAAPGAEIPGIGSGAAVLDGHKLSITGSFEGLRSPATVAHIHQSPVTGVRGPAALDLVVSKGTSG